MKSLIHKWTKTRKEKSKGIAGGSGSGSRQSSSESQHYGQTKLGKSNSELCNSPGMEAKDFGKVCHIETWPVVYPATFTLSARLSHVVCRPAGTEYPSHAVLG